MTRLEIAETVGATIEYVDLVLAKAGRLAHRLHQKAVATPAPPAPTPDLRSPRMLLLPGGVCPVSGLMVLARRFPAPARARAASLAIGGVPQSICKAALPPPEGMNANDADYLARCGKAHAASLIMLIAREGGGFADVVPPASDRRAQVFLDPRGPRAAAFSSAGSPAAACLEG
jgi:hypothetical protein